ncbi:MAG: 50S ribosomal protein L23 [Magnetococcales bacterium]|nr:50S ribosomal protein L23 [Magnetococcales bacterium]NGZ27504.1 50S ribosomal protein L23 [Magnetococcales bacterium]
MSVSGELYNVLLGPVITEKSTLCQQTANQVVFEVATWANKYQIKAAVEKMFSVQVLDVQTVNMKGKNKRFGRFKGRRRDWRKAFVRLQDGQNIDFYAKNS